MAYRYEYSARATRQLAKLHPQERERVFARVRELAQEPRGHRSKRLKGQPIAWGSRLGNLRIIYSIEDAEQCILVEAVGNRDQVYDLLRRR